MCVSGVSNLSRLSWNRRKQKTEENRCMLFGFLGKTWTFFFFFLNWIIKLVILFITFISSQDPHVVTGIKIYAQIWLAKKAHQEMHLQKIKTSGGKTTQFSSQKFDAQLCLRASCWSQWEALPVSLCSGKSFWSYITLLQARSPLCKLFLCCCWFRDSSRVSSGNLMLQLQCSIKHTALESAGAQCRPAVVAA